MVAIRVRISPRARTSIASLPAIPAPRTRTVRGFQPMNQPALLKMSVLNRFVLTLVVVGVIAAVPAAIAAR